jgi:hypothetical protein
VSTVTVARPVQPASPRAIRLGALAGTTVAHGFLPDPYTGSTCWTCFGWVNDYRHNIRLVKLR